MGESAEYDVDALEALQPGTAIGGYVVRRIIGRGGFGITYAAHNEVTRKDVAIKEFFPSSMVRRDGNSRLIYSKVNAETIDWALRKFRETTTTLCDLEHPNIVKVHDYVPTNDTGYMIMELLDGQTLEDWLKARPQPPGLDELHRIVDPVMEALSYVHGRGLIHRDIAPDNILITREGRPVLIDFGSVSRDLSDARQKAMSSTIGTTKRHYTAPEQSRAKARPTPEADVYSMGAVLYRALSGGKPADGQDRVDAMFHGKGSDPYEPLMKRPPTGCTMRAAQAIDAALAVRPEQRLRTIADLRAGMMPAAAVHEAPSISKRWLAAAALAVVLAAIGGAMAGGHWAADDNRTGQADLDRQRSELATARADVAKQRDAVSADRTQVDRSRAEVEAAKADLEAQRKKLDDARVGSDQEGASLQSLRADLDRQRAALKDRTDEADRQRQALQQTTADLDQQRQNLQVAQSELGQQREALAADRRRLDQDQSQSAQGARDDIDRLSRQLAESRAAAQDADRRRASAEAVVALVREQMREKDDTISTLSAENARLRRTNDQPVPDRNTSVSDVVSCTVYNLDPAGNNWLALRTKPSFQSTWSSTRMGPGTVVTAFGSTGDWRHVRLASGETGWANGRFLSCGSP